jgi:hypothetical protein
MHKLQDDKNWMRNLAIATAATVIGGIIVVFFTDWWEGSATKSRDDLEVIANGTADSGPAVDEAVPVPTMSQQAERLIGGAWRGADEECSYARHILVEGTSVEFRLHGVPVQSPLTLDSVQGDLVKATGERGPVTFTVVGDRLTYKSSSRTFEMEKCP